MFMNNKIKYSEINKIINNEKKISNFIIKKKKKF